MNKALIENVHNGTKAVVSYDPDCLDVQVGDAVKVGYVVCNVLETYQACEQIKTKYPMQDHLFISVILRSINEQPQEENMAEKHFLKALYVACLIVSVCSWVMTKIKSIPVFWLLRSIIAKQENTKLEKAAQDKIRQVDAVMADIVRLFDSGKLTREKVQELNAALTKIMGA